MDKLQVRGNNLIAIMIFGITVAVIFGLKRANIRYPRKVLLIVLALEVFGAWINLHGSFEQQRMIQALHRPSPGERNRTLEVELKRDTGKWQKTKIRVSARQPTKEEAIKALEVAEQQIQREYLGKNSDPKKVYQNLLLRSEYQGVVKAGWTTVPYGCISGDGQIRKDAVSEATDVVIRGVLRCRDEERTVHLRVTLVPLPYNSPNAFGVYMKKAFERADQTEPEEKGMKLPKTVAGQRIQYRSPHRNEGGNLALLGLASLLATVYLERRKEKEKKKKRQESLNRDYPMLLSQLGLFLGAGFSVTAAFTEVGKLYSARQKRGQPRGEGYEAILTLSRKWKDGCSERDGYMWLGEELENRNFRKLSLLLLQNMTKGDRELRDQLAQEEHMAFDERRIRAKVEGEEASTKLLLPMMGLLSVVLLVLMFPALQQLGI
ncbi:hypothetical protein SAMN02910400_01772 [Lachnospiraceae bacterium C10]|nr:hypothetical protein SAMN02910400_01772 [Lachnospiraceae bacterium C10]